MALSAGLLLYAITFQATEATILAFTWVHLGLLAAAVALFNLHALCPRPRQNMIATPETSPMIWPLPTVSIPRWPSVHCLCHLETTNTSFPRSV